MACCDLVAKMGSKNCVLTADVWPPAADGSPLVHARKQRLEASTKEIDQVQSYIQRILHKRGQFVADVYSLWLCGVLAQKVSGLQSGWICTMT